MAGLNFLGFTEESVRMLRYSVLKPATDAKAVEDDLINSITQLGNMTIESMKNSSMLEWASFQEKIAEEQKFSAQFQVDQMNQLVTDVKGQISAKVQEIEDHDSFLGQVGDFFSRLKSTIEKMPMGLTKEAGAGIAAEAGFGSSQSGGLLGLGAGASVMAGFAVFVYASYMSMSSMSDAANSRNAQLATLENKVLPLAQKQLDLAQRSFAITDLNRASTEGETTLARNLLSFVD